MDTVAVLVRCRNINSVGYIDVLGLISTVFILGKDVKD